MGQALRGARGPGAALTPYGVRTYALSVYASQSGSSGWSLTPKTPSWHFWHRPEMPYSFLEIASLKSPWTIEVSHITHRLFMTRSAMYGKRVNAGLERSGGRGMVMIPLLGCPEPKHRNAGHQRGSLTARIQKQSHQ